LTEGAILVILLHVSPTSPEGLVLVLVLLVAALLALHHALRLPQLPKYQHKPSEGRWREDRGDPIR